MSSTGEDGDGQAPLALHEIARRITPDRAAILGYIVEHGSEEDGVKTSEARKAAGVAEGSTHHHIARLRDDWQLIEEVGEVGVVGGLAAKLYAPTERGERFVERGDADVSEPLTAEEQSALVDRVDDLAARVEELEAENESLREDLASHREALTEMKRFRDDLVAKNEEIIDYVNTLERRVTGLGNSQNDG